MEFTDSLGSVELRWNFRRQFDEGIVPDRPVQYSGTGRMYRPRSVNIHLHAHKAALSVEDLGISFLNQAGLVAKVDSVTIHGFSVLKSGKAGGRDHHEKIWRDENYPDWVKTLLTELLYEINSR